MSRRKPHSVPDVPASVGDFPLVAVLGRPNVGKSTLFNRLVGRHVAIVEDRPGVTRDRLLAEASIDDKTITLMDMGGYESSPEGAIEIGISEQCRAGLSRADLVLFVVDGRSLPTNGDYETAEMLRRSDKPSILVVNKIDGDRHEQEAGDSFALGIEPTAMVSALHGRGIADLEDLMYERLPETFSPADDEVEDLIRVAIIGRPNAGKSSLVNRLLGEERLLTLDEPGTTRDPVDTLFVRGDQRYVLIDTAGIRRKRSVAETGAEKLAVTAAIRAIERAHVVVILIDADEGTAEQDAKIIGLAMERNRAVVVALNKWDQVMKRDARERKRLTDRTLDILSFVKWASPLKISVIENVNLDALLDRVDRTFEQFCRRVSTGQVNRLFEDIIAHHPPPLSKGKAVKLYYATQASVRPPTFVVHANYPEAIHFSYRRYIENRIRETFGFDGTPVRVLFRKRKRRENP